MIAILILSAKLTTPGFLRIKPFWNKGFDDIISVHDVINKILSLDSNHIVNVVMWPKFGNSSVSRREVIITLILQEFDQNTEFFWGVFLVQAQ